jgi:hypothetical protein
MGNASAREINEMIAGQIPADMTSRLLVGRDLERLSLSHNAEETVRRTAWQAMTRRDSAGNRGGLNGELFVLGQASGSPACSE